MIRNALLGTLLFASVVSGQALPESRPAGRTTEPTQVPVAFQALVVNNTARARSFHQTQEREDPQKWALPGLPVKIHTYDLQGEVDVIDMTTDERGVLDLNLGERLTGKTITIYVDGGATRYLSMPVPIQQTMAPYFYCYEITENPGVLSQQVTLILTDPDAREDDGSGLLQVRQLIQLKNLSYNVYLGPKNNPTFSFQVPPGGEVTGLQSGGQVIARTDRQEFDRFTAGVPIEAPIYPTFMDSDAVMLNGTYTIPAQWNEDAVFSYTADVPIQRIDYAVEVGTLHFLHEKQPGFRLSAGQRIPTSPMMPKETQLYFAGDIPAGTRIPLIVRYGKAPFRPLDPVTLLVVSVMGVGFLMAVGFGSLVARARRRARTQDHGLMAYELDQKFAVGEIDSATYHSERAKVDSATAASER